MNLPTLGTHNLLDGSGTATAFADYLFFTEATPDDVRAQLGDDYEIRVCAQQRDLIIAWRKGTFTPARNKKGHERIGYKRAHPGIRKVTPNRGTFWIIGYDADGVPTVLVDEHRINAAFPPFKRGERIYRPLMWKRHTRITLRRVRKWLRKGWQVFAGGDLNTPNESVKGYRGVLYEVGDHFDRIGSSEDLEHGEVLSREGSDHNRLRTAVRDFGRRVTKRNLKRRPRTV